MEQINLNKRVYSKNQYERVIDNKFSQLGTLTTSSLREELIKESLGVQVSIEQFFAYYKSLFYQIPKTGSINSHEYLVKTSTEYVGANIVNDDIQALIDEINLLQQTNLELNQTLVELNVNITASQQS